jgi:predicted RNA-binding Zn-ribbon protein involved in translation (DUF1610 family)
MTAALARSAGHHGSVVTVDGGLGDDSPVLYCLSCGARIPRSAFPEPGEDTVTFTCSECGARGQLARVERR